MFHAVHKRPFDHIKGAAQFNTSRFGILFDELNDTLHEAVGDPLSKWEVSPLKKRARVLLGAFALKLFGEGNQLLGSVGMPIKHHILDALQKLGLDLLVHLKHASVYDTHIETCSNGVVEEYRVHGFSHGVISPE